LKLSLKDTAGSLGAAGTAGFNGSEGLFAAIEDRGIVYNDPDFDFWCCATALHHTLQLD
jgi:hypothetical protein